MKQILHSFRMMLALAAMLCVSVQASAVVFASGDCGANGSNCKWYIERGTDNVYQLRISGTGRMADYSQLYIAPWYEARPTNGEYFYKAYITRIVVEEGVTHIGEKAFAMITKLTTVTLSNTVTSIGQHAFYGNPALQTLNLPSTTHLSVVGIEVVSDCPALTTITGADVIDNGWYTYPATELIAYPGASYAYSYTVADGCRLIRMRAFDYSQLYQVTLPASLEELGWAAFYQAANLTDIYAHPLTAPTYTTYIVTFLDGSTKTDSDINLHIHNAAYASYSDTNLKWSDMNIVRDLDPDFEGDCGANATYSFDPTTGTLTISGTGEMWDYTSYSGHTAPWKNWSSWSSQYTYVDVQKVVIGEGITKVGNSAFFTCYNLSEVTFPSTLLTISSGAFSWCGLTGVTLPANLQEIESEAFYRNQSLQSLAFTNMGEMIIGSNAFNMTALTDIYAPWSDAVQVPTLPTGVFGTIDSENPPTLHVKPGTGNFYTGKNVWKDLIIMEDNYNEDDLIQMMVDLALLDHDGNPVSGGAPKAPAAVLPSGECEYSVSFVDENGNPAEDDFDLYGLGLLSGCRTFGGIYWRGQSMQAIITPSTTSESYGFDHWEIDYSAYEGLANILPATLQHIRDNVSEDPATHALTINLEFGIMPNYVELGEVPLFPFHFVMYYKEGAVANKHLVTLNATFGGEIQGAETGYFDDGEELNLNAIAYSGYEFVSWSDGVTTASRTLIVTSDTTLTATFQDEVKYGILIFVNDASMGVVTGVGLYKPGETVQITATPYEGYEFVGWDDDGDGEIDNTQAVRTFPATESITFHAYFQEAAVTPPPTPQYTLTVISSDESKGSVTGGGTYDEGTTVQIVAIPKSGYEFVQWNDGNTENPRSIVLSSDSTFTASFKEAEVTPPAETTYTVSLIANDNAMGTVIGGGSYKEGTTIQIAAMPNEGYEFVQWNDGNTDNPRSLVVTENTVLMAVFRAVSTPPVEEKTYYIVTLIANPTDGGTFLGAGSYEEGTTAIIAAQPSEGYEFVNWNDGVNTAARQLTVNDNIILVANFHRIGEGLITPSDSPSRGEKLLRNGILIIRVGDKEYNAQGVLIEN